MRFLADMGVSLKTVESLRVAGHHVVHLSEEGLQRFSDPEILAKAWREDRIVLTFDLDFGELVAAAGSTLPSAIIFRLRNQTAESVTPRLEQVVEEESEQLSAGAIVIIEESRYRLRRLPLP
jgi:predicted nuclease of predicted toxin-antitoxin system